MLTRQMSGNQEDLNIEEATFNEVQPKGQVPRWHFPESSKGVLIWHQFSARENDSSISRYRCIAFCGE